LKSPGCCGRTLEPRLLKQSLTTEQYKSLSAGFRIRNTQILQAKQRCFNSMVAKEASQNL
jgi:hypothetical protein